MAAMMVKIRKGSKIELLMIWPGARQLDEADHRGERGILDDLHHEADGRRRGDADGLRQDHLGVIRWERLRPGTRLPPTACFGTDSMQPRQISPR